MIGYYYIALDLGKISNGKLLREYLHMASDYVVSDKYFKATISF